MVSQSKTQRFTWYVVHVVGTQDVKGCLLSSVSCSNCKWNKFSIKISSEIYVASYKYFFFGNFIKYYIKNRK